MSTTILRRISRARRAVVFSAAAVGLLTVAVLASSAAAAKSSTTITIADGWGDTPNVSKAFAAVVSAFEQKYGVKVNLETEGSNAYNQSINLRASSNNPPDVFMLSTSGYGPGFYTLARAAALAPLDGYAKKYGWDARFNATALGTFRFNRAKSQWGVGALYGLPEQNTMLGVYYNKKLLAQAGFRSPPTTMAAFEKSLAAAKANGIVPLAATKDAYIHDEIALWDAFAPNAASVNNWVYGISGTFANPANLKALQTLARWQSNGWLQPGSEGVSYGSAVGALTSGQALYFIAGPWLAGAVQGTLGANGGFFQMPSVSSKSPVGGGPSSPLVISAKSKHKDIGAKFLDFFNSTKESNFLVKAGWGPTGASVNLKTVRAAPLTKSLLAILVKVESPTGAGTTPYIDWAAPTIGNDIPAGLDDLIAGHQTPESFTASIQNDWVTFKQQRASGH
jgi:raffinose/stachyose/melibiose transport system substrate-binding protein